MKKVILLVFGCLAFVSVQAQSISSEERIQKLIDSKVQTITTKVNFSEEQKTFLVKYINYTIKSRANTSYTQTHTIEDVNMDTFFSEEQRMVIQKELAAISMTLIPSNTSRQGISSGTRTEF